MFHPVQTSKYYFIGLILVFIGCSEDNHTPVKLDTTLGMHYSLIQEGQTGSARVRLRQHMDKNGESVQPLFLMGLSYHHDKQYAQAIKWFAMATSKSMDASEYPPVWHFLGWSHYYLGQVAASKSSFEQFLVLYPNEADSLFALGLIATEEGDLGKAKKLFLKAIQGDSQDNLVQAKATARLADVLADEGDWQEAITLYRETVRLNPDVYEAWYRLSRALLRVGNEEESTVALGQFELARRRVRPDLDQSTRFPE